MTLRLDPRMDDDLDDLAYDLRLSRAGTIRRILGRAIADAYDHATQNTHLRVQGGAL
jgi:predicted transcriptional regulator